MYKGASRFMQRPVSDRHNSNDKTKRKRKVLRAKIKRCTAHGRSNCKVCKRWKVVKETLLIEGKHSSRLA
jgi:hypothetical protein